MDIKMFKEIVFNKAKELQLKEFEVYYSSNSSLSINVFKSDVDKYSLESDTGVSFRCIDNGKMGYSYTEKLTEEEAIALVERAKESAIYTESTEKQFIYGGKDDYVKVNCFNEELENAKVENKTSKILELEAETFKASDKVSHIAHCEYKERTSEVGIINSKGLDLYHKANNLLSYVAPIVKDGNLSYNGIGFVQGNDLGQLNISKLSKEAIEDSLSRVGGKSIKSGRYKGIIENRAMALLLKTFAAVFSGENAQKGLSLLNGKEGEVIASSNINLIDNPHLEGGICTSPFDSEGVATYCKNIIKNGELVTLLHNLKTANNDNKKSTGNGVKQSYNSPVSVTPSNLYIENGDKNFEELLSVAKNGVIITELAGTHAGANAITGDFSLAAKGFLIEDGKKSRAIEQITISSNFFELLKSIEIVGSDLKFGMSSGSGYFGSPSVILSEIYIAGE
ncbi:TldD/PmbA family protein [Clostridium sp.]|uniref:TldD/PmbA family protein n=1 Tax=Clostridium sp. TaxID=1506 RepID=UPI0032175229